MQEENVTFEVAKLAKEKGFNEECRNYYQDSKRAGVFSINKIDNQTIDDLHNNDKYCVIHFSTPTQSLLQRWLREVHNIHININFSKTIGYGLNRCFYYTVEQEINDMQSNIITSGRDSTEESIEDWIKFKAKKSFEEALEEGLRKGLKEYE